MDFKFYKYELMLLELLRASLKQEKVNVEVFESCSMEEWNKCYKLAKKQGVMALAWDGVPMLPSEVMPPRDLKLKWALAVENYEKQYRCCCDVVKELSDYYALHSIAMMQLKGVGYASSYYPKPEHREGGDIDIYTYSANKNVMSDKEASELADRLMQEQGIAIKRTNIKHSEFCFHGFLIENHKYFLDITQLKSAICIDNLLQQYKNPTRVSLGSKQVIQVPTNEFNTLFISFHALRHYGEGMCLHHLCDWACLLNQYGLHIPKGVTDKKYLTFIATITAFVHHFLGGNVSIEYSEQALNNMILELFRSPYAEKCNSKNLLKVFYFKLRRFVHVCRIQKEVMNYSVFKHVSLSIKRMLRNLGVISSEPKHK